MVQFLVCVSFCFKLWCVNSFLNCESDIMSEVYADYLSELSGEGCDNSHCNVKIGGNMWCFQSVIRLKPWI